MTTTLRPESAVRVPVEKQLHWARSCEQLRQQLEALRELWADRDELAAAPIRVAPLGVRDELAQGPDGWLAQRPDGWLAQRPDGEPPTSTLVVYLAGTQAVFGPLGGRARVGCPRCLARRWQAVQNVPVREALEFGAPLQGIGEPPVTTAFAATALATALAGADYGTDADRYHPVYRIDLHSLAIRRYRLIADPDCPDCGGRSADTAELAVPALSASPKRAGSFRQKAIADYDLPMNALVNPVCGMIGRGIVPELDLPSSSAIWGCFATRTVDDMYEIYWAGHTNCYDTSVRIGMLEGLERYSGMAPRAKSIDTVTSLDALTAAGTAALDPRDCGVYSEEFYRDTSELVPFTPDRNIPWVWGYSLRDERPLMIPEVVSYYHSSAPEQRFVQECSNGCATGGTLVEAIYSGLMELIERDAFLLTWYGKVSLPEIDPRTSARPATRMMVDRLALYGYRARFFDARLTFGIPVVIGAAQRTDGQLGALCVGAGSGLAGEDALAASLVEIATDSMNHRRRTERLEPALRQMLDDFDKVLRIHDHPQLYGLPEMAHHAGFLLDAPASARRSVADTFADQPIPESTDLLADLRWCIDQLAAAGLDVIVIDQSSPEQLALGLHTACVIVPGLLPLDFGWYRQRALHMPRMRTALHQAGLVDRELDYDDLNLVPHPFP